MAASESVLFVFHTSVMRQLESCVKMSSKADSAERPKSTKYVQWSPLVTNTVITNSRL